jgi:predicted nucleic acid-binding protein
MPQGLVLVDTSVWIEVLGTQGDQAYRSVMNELTTQGCVATCEVVIAEVLQGALDARQLGRLNSNLAATVALEMDGAGEVAGRLAWTLRRRGFTIHTTDLLIAATAHLHGAALLHRDRHLGEAADALGLQVIEP